MHFHVHHSVLSTLPTSLAFTGTFSPLQVLNVLPHTLDTAAAAAAAVE
jgi:hypothetical protein